MMSRQVIERSKASPTNDKTKMNEKLELKEYAPVVRKHVIYKEAKIK